MDALSRIFLLWLLCLNSYVSYFLHLSPGMFIFFVFLRMCSRHLLLSANTLYELFLLVICILPQLGITFYNCFVFPGSYYPGGVLVVLSYTALDFANMDYFATSIFFLSHCDHKICISLRKESERTLG